MYPDKTLTPKESTRLCALGSLALCPMPYSKLATEIRTFISHITGPSLDIMAQSIELLRYEGLIETIDNKSIIDDPILKITESGHKQLLLLLNSNLRQGATELNKVVIALKFRFLHLLSTKEQKQQILLLQQLSQNELANLEELRQIHGEDTGFLPLWLDHDINMINSRINWLEDLYQKIIF